MTLSWLVMPCPGLTSIFDPRSVRPSSFSFVLFGGRFTKEDGASGQAHPSPVSKTVLSFLDLNCLGFAKQAFQPDQSLFKEPCKEQWARAGEGLCSVIFSRYILPIWMGYPGGSLCL
ncbi:hypothetical protein NXS19_011963 [Fusarium pseudograminearum]|nr:hypothetical protein NXS19_011963 [Fusarium pseudograminearum]